MDVTMKRKRGKFLISLGVLLVLIFISTYFLHVFFMKKFKLQVLSKTDTSLTSRVDQQEEVIGGARIVSISDHDSQDIVSLSTKDLEKYGSIASQKKSVVLKTQSHWDSTMRRMLRKSDVIGTIDSNRSFQGVKKTPQQFEYQVQRFDKRIRIFEDKVQRNPNDDVARTKLEDLYRLRSSLKVLEKVVVQESK